MTDQEALFRYRLQQARETLADAEKMLQGQMSSRSIVNRAYYVTFYAILALFIKASLVVRSSKHAGIIALFDKNFVLAGKIEKRYSQILHKLFEARQEVDYKEFTSYHSDDAKRYVEQAKEFLERVEQFIDSLEHET